MDDIKQEEAFVEDQSATNWERYGSDPDTVEAFKTIMAWSPDERRKHERALVRRLDLIIMLPAVIMYVTNYLDRNSIAQGTSSSDTAPSADAAVPPYGTEGERERERDCVITKADRR